MMTFGRGLVIFGAGRDHWYASVSTAMFGNSSLMLSAMVFTARNSGPPGVPSSSMICCATESLQ